MDTDQINNEGLRGMCENVLHLITTTISNMELVCVGGVGWEGSCSQLELGYWVGGKKSG